MNSLDATITKSTTWEFRSNWSKRNATFVLMDTAGVVYEKNVLELFLASGLITDADAGIETPRKADKTLTAITNTPSTTIEPNIVERCGDHPMAVDIAPVVETQQSQQEAKPSGGVTVAATQLQTSAIGGAKTGGTGDTTDMPSVKAKGKAKIKAAAKQKVKLEEGATADKPMKVANKSASPREQLKTLFQATKPKVESSFVPPPKL